MTPVAQCFKHEPQTPTRHGAVMLTPADAARLAKVSRDTIYREIDRGALRALHVGRLLRIDPHDFRRWLKGGTERACSGSSKATGRPLRRPVLVSGVGWLTRGR